MILDMDPCSSGPQVHTQNNADTENVEFFYK